MANEFKHKDPGAELTQAEFIAACGDGHIFACQATGDIVYASSATVLSKLAKGSAGTVLSMGCSCIPAWTTNAASATLAATVTVIDSTDTSSFVALFDSATGDLAAKTDAGLAYNSGTGTLTATAFAGPITGNVTGNASGTALTVTQAAQCAITSLGTLTGLTLSGDATLTGAATDVDLIDNNACAISFDAAGQAGILAIDTQNCAEGVKMSGKLTVTGAISTTGAVTVGACDTGLDVKFFGASAGAFMLYDQSCDLLEVRGATAAGPGHLKLTTGEATVVACDVLGKIEFQAPAETGADALRISASIAAVAQATFDATNNATDLVFYTGHSEDAAEKFRFTSQNEIGIAGANYGTDGQVLTSGGAGAAVAWEDAAGGGGLIFIGSVEASSTSTLTVTGLDCTYEAYLITINASAATDGAAWGLRLGCSGGIKTGASDYEWAQAHFLSSTCAYSDNEDPCDCEIQIFNASGSCGDEGIAGTFWLHTDGASGIHPVVTGHGVTTYCSGVMGAGFYGGTLQTAVDVTQFQIRTRTGSFDDGGRMTVWGLKHS